MSQVFVRKFFLFSTETGVSLCWQGFPMEADGSERHAKVDGTREEGQAVAGRCRHVEVNALLTTPVSPRAELLAVGREEGHPVDVVGRGATLNPDDVVVLEDDGLTLDLILEDGVYSAVHDATLGGVSNVDGPDETLINNLNSFREFGDMGICEESALIDVTEGSGLFVRAGDC